MEKIENDEDDKHIVLTEKHYADFTPAAVPISPDGGIVPGFAAVPPPPQAYMTPENFVCLRGPCRYYWHLVTDIDMENPDDTWASLTDPLTGKPLTKPRQHTHTCLANPGMETDLTGDSVFECSKWDPFAPTELAQLHARRAAYHAAVDPEPTEEYDGNHSDDAA